VTLLSEVAETDATGRIAELYDEIRATLGLPLVNLVYRHLAATGELEAVWAQLRPALAGVDVALAVDAPAVARIPPAALAAVGADTEACLATLEVYRRGNSLNLLAMRALLDGADGGGRAGAPAAPLPEALPMADIAALRPPVRALLDEMSAVAGEPGLVPSLFRHFAHDPALLALLWTAIAPVAGDVPRCAAAVRVDARPARPVERLEGPLRETCARFAGAMARMLVAGELLRRALAG
jgi:hypothetical protein